MTPFRLDVAVGNVNCILFSAVALSFYLLYNRRQAVVSWYPSWTRHYFKVTPAAIWIYLLLSKQWRVSLSALFTAGIFSGITALWLGPTCLIHYAEKFMAFGQTSMKNGPAPYNQSLIGVLGAFVQHHSLHWPSYFLNACFLIS